MKASSRPQYYRIRRMVQMVREGAETGYLPNSSDFMKEFEVSRRTVARDLDFLRDEERAPLAYDDARHGFRLTDETYTLPPVRISRKEAFSFGLARKLLAHYEGTPLHLDMRSVLDKIAESLEGDITIEPDWLSEHVGVMPEDCVRIDPEVWAQIAGFIERREEIRATYQTFDGRSTKQVGSSSIKRSPGTTVTVRRPWATSWAAARKSSRVAPAAFRSWRPAQISGEIRRVGVPECPASSASSRLAAWRRYSATVRPVLKSFVPYAIEMTSQGQSGMVVASSGSSFAPPMPRFRTSASNDRAQIPKAVSVGRTACMPWVMESP